MKYKTILITGGAGFIGSNLAVKFKEKYPGLKIIALDSLKRRGSEMNLQRLKDYKVDFIHGDIRNKEDLNLNKEIGLLIECSAEPSVLAGFGDNPEYIINTNLCGTINCLELARKNKADVIFLSTSRVYPYSAINNIRTKELATRLDWKGGQKIKGWSDKGINEDFTFEGAKSLYGATKLASELLLREYIASYGINGVINRCGVIAGPWQFGKVDQGVFTYWMLAHYFKKPLNYIGFGGRGKQVRDLLHIDDLFRLIDLQAFSFSLAKINGKVYNVGGGRQVSLSLTEATNLCQRITGNRLTISSKLSNRPADIAIYLSDNSKVSKELGWHPLKSSSQIFADIYSWIRSSDNKIKQVLL